MVKFGIIYAITRTDICIRFIHKEVRLPIDEAHMIMPAYAITVHKSQGSEYGVVYHSICSTLWWYVAT